MLGASKDFAMMTAAILLGLIVAAQLAKVVRQNGVAIA